MSRSNWLGLLASLACLTMAVPSAALAQQKPNILFILAHWRRVFDELW
jgi:hypothetical protein